MSKAKIFVALATIMTTFASFIVVSSACASMAGETRIPESLME